METWELAGNVVRTGNINAMVREVYGPGAVLSEPCIASDGVGYRVLECGWTPSEDAVLDTATLLAV